MKPRKIYPFPGAHLYKDIRRYGSFQENWDAFTVKPAVLHDMSLCLMTAIFVDDKVVISTERAYLLNHDSGVS